MAYPVDINKVIEQMRQSGETSGATPEVIKVFCEQQFAKYEQLLDKAEQEGNIDIKALTKQFELWSSLLDSIKKYGRLTTNQEVMVCRSMRRNTEAPLPAFGERIIVEGDVVSAKGFTGDDGNISVKLSVFDKLSREAIVNIWSSTKLFGKLGISAYQDHNGKTIVTDYPKHIRVIGTVDWISEGVYKIKRPALVVD